MAGFFPNTASYVQWIALPASACDLIAPESISSTLQSSELWAIGLPGQSLLLHLDFAGPAACQQPSMGVPLNDQMVTLHNTPFEVRDAHKIYRGGI
jgi:hypothetical protein